MHNVQQNRTFVFQPHVWIKNLHLLRLKITFACSSHIAVTQLSSGQRSGEFIRKYGRSSQQRPHMRLESYQCLHEMKMGVKNINGGALLHWFISMKPQKCVFQYECYLYNSLFLLIFFFLLSYFFIYIQAVVSQIHVVSY